jgi:hypothetical protein
LKLRPLGRHRVSPLPFLAIKRVGSNILKQQTMVFAGSCLKGCLRFGPAAISRRGAKGSVTRLRSPFGISNLEKFVFHESPDL